MTKYADWPTDDVGNIVGTRLANEIYHGFGGLMNSLSFDDQKDASLAELIATRDDLFNVKSFGAKGDGSTDDTAAIESALSAATSSGAASTVFFPDGVYAHTGITLETTMYGVRLVGSGARRAILKNTHASNSSITLDGVHQPRISDLGIRGNPDGTGNGIVTVTTSGFQTFLLTLERLWIHGHGTNAASGGNGISGRPFSYAIRDCLIGGNSTDDPGGGLVAHNRANGIVLTASLGGTIENVWVADIQSGFVGLLLQSSPATTSVRGCNFSSETAGANWAGIQIDGTSTTCVMIEGCNFECDAVNTMDNGVLVSGTSWKQIVMSHCNFVAGTGTVTDVIDFVAPGVDDGAMALLLGLEDGLGNVNLRDMSAGYVYSLPYIAPTNDANSRMMGVRPGGNANGTATLANGNTTVAVTHGLGVTPDIQDISVTPIETWGSATKFWAHTPTSTQFTIEVDQNPTQDVDFAWTASVQ